MARPSKYTVEFGKKICGRLLDGRSLRSICAKFEDMPAQSTIYEWLNTYPEFTRSYEIARMFAKQAILDEMLEIADNSENDYITDKQGRRRLNPEPIKRDRLRIYVRQRDLERMASKKYAY